MSWSTRHKIFYFFVFIIALAIVTAIPALFIFHKAPTCSDGKKNGDETGIDCGGSCQRLCRAEQLPPVVFWQQAFRVSSTTYSAVAYVQNPNPNGEVASAGYSFEILDKGNQVIAERKGNAYIPPGRNFAVFESGIQLPEGKEYGRALFEFDSALNWVVAGKDVPTLGVLNQQLSHASTSPSIDADIQNPSFNPVQNIEVTAIIYDNEGNAFAASKTYVDGIAQQGTKHVVFTWPAPFAVPVAKIEIIPVIVR